MEPVSRNKTKRRMKVVRRRRTTMTTTIGGDKVEGENVIWGEAILVFPFTIQKGSLSPGRFHTFPTTCQTSLQGRLTGRTSPETAWLAHLWSSILKARLGLLGGFRVLLDLFAPLLREDILDFLFFLFSFHYYLIRLWRKGGRAWLIRKQSGLTLWSKKLP